MRLFLIPLLIAVLCIIAAMFLAVPPRAAVRYIHALDRRVDPAVIVVNVPVLSGELFQKCLSGVSWYMGHGMEDTFPALPPLLAVEIFYLLQQIKK